MEDRFQVGIITSSHGVRGEVKVYPTTDDIRRFKKLKEVILVSGKTEQTLEVEQVKFLKQMVLLKFKGLDSINDIEKFRQASLFVTRQDAVRLQKDEYFIADLIGMHVYNEDDEKIGVLQEVLETGANDVYQIALTDGRELLLPAIRQCILEVRIEEGYMRVHVLEGLLD